jgi:hypothetical protein
MLTALMPGRENRRAHSVAGAYFGSVRQGGFMTKGSRFIAPAASLLVALTVSGCATRAPVYMPVGRGPDGTQMPVQAYAPVGDLKQGYVRVLALGSGPLPSGGGTDRMYLHVRLDAHNFGDGIAWTFHASEQRLSCGGATVPPTLARTSLGGPVLVARARARAWMDLYYPLPEASPKTLTLSWTIRRGAEASTQAT